MLVSKSLFKGYICDFTAEGELIHVDHSIKQVKKSSQNGVLIQDFKFPVTHCSSFYHDVRQYAEKIRKKPCIKINFYKFPAVFFFFFLFILKNFPS